MKFRSLVRPGAYVNVLRRNLMPNEFDRLIAQAGKFRERLQSLKKENPPEGFTWFGYDSLSNVEVLPQLLTGEARQLLQNLDGPIADVGGADGELAFFLESQGFDCRLLENPDTNWNRLQGARRLRELLDSKLPIDELDLDGPFEMPERRFGLVIFFGLLYHLKNPIYVLERFASVSRWMILSTRIARRAKQDDARIADLPVAYLLGPEECNNDATNYWIFSPAGLERVLSRAGWAVRTSFTSGETEASNPSDPDHDERAYLLAESRLNRGH